MVDWKRGKDLSGTPSTELISLAAISPVVMASRV
jgi:hypothetical protein